jgi:transposase
MCATNYPSDLTNEQRQVIRPLLPKPAERGRPPIDRRDILDAILYVVRTGCQWRQLPLDFPKWKTVDTVFWRWRKAEDRKGTEKVAATKFGEYRRFRQIRACYFGLPRGGSVHSSRNLLAMSAKPVGIAERPIAMDALNLTPERAPRIRCAPQHRPCCC